MNRPARQQVQPRGYKPTFAAFLADRGTRKPSTPTMKAYRHDFDTIAERIVGSDEGVKAMSLSNITTEAMRTAFAQYAETHEAASIQRCWSTWNVLRSFTIAITSFKATSPRYEGKPKSAKAWLWCRIIDASRRLGSRRGNRRPVGRPFRLATNALRARTRGR